MKIIILKEDAFLSGYIVFFLKQKKGLLDVSLVCTDQAQTIAG